MKVERTDRVLVTLVRAGDRLDAFFRPLTQKNTHMLTYNGNMTQWSQYEIKQKYEIGKHPKKFKVRKARKLWKYLIDLGFEEVEWEAL